MKFLSALCFPAAVFLPNLAATAQAQQLGGAAGPDVSIWRTLLTLLFCLFIGGIAIWFLHKRNLGRSGKIAQKSVFASKIPFLNEAAPWEIEILEMRKLNVQSDICLLRFRGMDYLVILGAGGVTILSQMPMKQEAGSQKKSFDS